MTRHGEIVEHREADLGTREFEVRVLHHQYAQGEISYADYVQRLAALIRGERP